MIGLTTHFRNWSIRRRGGREMPEKTCGNCKGYPGYAQDCEVGERQVYPNDEECGKWENMFDDRSEAEKRDDARLAGFLH